MGQRMWLGAWVLVLGLGGAGVACDGGSGSGGGGSGGGTGTFECPLRSQVCEQCLVDKCSANCKSASTPRLPEIRARALLATSRGSVVVRLEVPEDLAR